MDFNASAPMGLRTGSRAERLGLTEAELADYEAKLTPGVIDAVLEALIRFEEAVADLGR